MPPNLIQIQTRFPNEITANYKIEGMYTSKVIESFPIMWIEQSQAIEET
jgi:hypothetical protein